ncbi:MAG: class II fructose-bisphosphate aldolase [Oscillospiraceae bacterium]|nr:class II fructose-bisphosphate aldolase [Oscillospiraceae bacterium]MBQ9250873.1 class II fructose-bisphosphate aldolase [Oscillospiraceae bacterium]
MLVNMKEMLRSAQEGKYGVGFFDTVNVEMVRAVIETAEELRAPVMVGITQTMLPVMPLERAAEIMLPAAEKASVPVCVHFDHGLDFETCMAALKLGFRSIMYDCSTAPYEENVAQLAEMVRICHAEDVTVEGELGHVGDNEGAGKLSNPSDFYTDPDVAADFAARTGIDALAVAVGNAHGDYKFPPKLDFERIRKIAELTRLPLVLHGGSGLADGDFRRAVSEGICKVNIFTDLDRAGRLGIEEGLRAGAGTMLGLIPYEIAAMKVVAAEKIRLFGSEGKV